jgi:lysophospholipase L1-like esterase
LGTAGDNEPRGQQPFRSHSLGQRNPWTALSHGRDHDLLGPGDLVGGTDCLHPNDAGHQKIAEAFAAVLAGADAQAAA